MNSILDPLLVAVLFLLAITSIGLRGRVLGRRRTLVAAERLLRAERPGIDQGWSMSEWDWAIKKVRAGTASEQAVMADGGQSYSDQDTSNSMLTIVNVGCYDGPLNTGRRVHEDGRNYARGARYRDHEEDSSG